MKCPYCNMDDTRVVDSRAADENTTIRRRRQCENCGARFTTYEKVETFPVMVVKKDNTREPFERRKIEAGVVRASHKRPVSAEQISGVVDAVETAIYDMDTQEVSSSVIGELVMEQLKGLDEVTYVRFASVYREFTDVNTFAEELITLLQAKKEEKNG
ncbi:MAG: transcriptional repressor NrdR [Lachnospiraceae bacterium]|nr:transcriptional repressor NrdR [Lachnospiraceae bacterium]